MTRGLLQELGPKHSREGAGREIPCPLSFCSGLPPAKPSQKQRARKPGGFSFPGLRVDLGDKWRITSIHVI